jgi:hypothetical protein
MKILLSLLAFFILGQAHAQTLNYDIKHSGKKIGHMEVEKTAHDNTETYHITSHVDVKLVFHMKISYKLQTVFKDNELYYSSITTYENGDLHSTIKTKKNGDHYDIIKDGHETKYMKTINQTGATVYHSMPTNRPMMYSEFEGEDKKLEKVNDHTVKYINLNDGHVNMYTYKNGVMQHAEIENSVMNFTFELHE